ncbi:MAG: 2-dehydro-3-deoxygalactonokinase [Caulobacter sp.]|nr:2-dehydro-3-deoxygalactonokinase [Caulobacter sp.]
MMGSADTPLLAGDWGSTNLRLFLIDADGTVTATRQSAHGVRNLRPDQFRAAFEDLAVDLLDGATPAAILLCGMVGARQGWLEAPYAEAPAGPAEIAAHFARVETRWGPAWIAPGLIARRPDGRADVMRGEETQILGAGADGTIVTPGTHSKWARTEGGRITAFTTYMTGELFEVLKRHSMLGALIEDGPRDAAAFDLGVARAKAGEALQSLLFSVRSEGLTGALPAPALASYLSGLLIGAEIAAGLADAPGAAPTLIGDPALTSLYTAALAGFGLKPACVIDGGAAVAAGLWRLWRERSSR